MSQQQFEINQNSGSGMIRYIIIGVIILIVIIFFSSATFLTIDPGHRGVIFHRFGGGLDKEHVKDQGFHVIAPWNKMYVYNVRVKEGFEKMSALSSNGLTIKVDLSYRYFPVHDSIGYLHDEIGKDYHENIVLPEIRSATREVIGQYLPEELYSGKRTSIQKEIFEKTRDKLDNNYITLDAVLIREVQLPTSLQNAIEKKLQQEQAALAYEFRLEREQKEAQRKIIEANAQAEANKILSKSLTEEILRDKGIDATLKLAGSENTKIVVVGGGESGLPLILNE